jgi:hypothetical protein
MAWFNQEMKAARAPSIKSIAKKYGVKVSLGVNNHSTFVINIKSGSIDFIKNYNETVALAYDDHRRAEGSLRVNEYWYHEHFTGKAKAFLKELMEAANVGNHDNSDPQTDYFDVGFYTSINVGQWDKPYVYEAK